MQQSVRAMCPTVAVYFRMAWGPMSKLATGILGAGAVGLALAATGARASDVLTYPAPAIPPAGNPVYAPVSLVTGDISLGLGWFDEDGYGAFELLGAGRINAPLQGGPWNLTGEIWGGAWFQDPTFAEVLGAAHLYYKTDPFAHGVYAGWACYGESGTAATKSPSASSAGFMSNTARSAGLPQLRGQQRRRQLRLLERRRHPPLLRDAGTKLAGIVGWWSDDGGWMLGGGVEHLFAGTNVTGFARANWFTEGGGYDSWEVLGGARFFFHRPGTTLQQHDWDIPFAEATVVNF